ncbi:hypothetical protein A9Q84_12290 [Halobacteriovorax marinus]|uniref:Uncharacterized protein n=1 Tax=Halobacteriovorax marinus TaxID=97084 RepID=A0A1Y5F896_9BACT|nr:hypothetical protein A9Q84_12290 [Halobacteriovorax marinus]
MLVELDERVLSLLKEGLSSEFDSTVHCVSGLEKVKDLLSAVEFDLIIVRNKFLKDDVTIEAAKGVMNTLYDLRKSVPVIVLGEFDFPYGTYEVLPDRFRIEELYRLIIKVLNISEAELKQLKLPEFVGMAIENFTFMENTCCDIYIKLDSKEGEKYLKRINKFDSIDRDVILKYKNNHVHFFYVKKNEHTNLLNHLLQHSLEKIVQISKSAIAIHEIHSENYGISQNLIEAVGITPHTIRLANAAIGVMRKSIEGHGEISELLEQLLANKTSYAYKRNYLISALVHELTPHLNWGTGEQLEAQNEKMTFLSFFHDIYLREESHLKIFSNEEAKDLDIQSSELVLNHANKAAVLIQSFPHSPSDVDIFIKQHHGTVKGVGFPDFYSASISPMVIVFIVIEKYTYYILEMTPEKLKNENVKEIIFNQLYDDFHQPSYRKIVDIFKKLKFL